MLDRFEALRNLGSEPWAVGMMAFLGASFAGLASLLRSGKSITPRTAWAAILNSGMQGIIIALMGYDKFSGDIPYLIGISIFAGIGGATMTDFALQVWQRRGVTISIKPNRRKTDRENKDE